MANYITDMKWCHRGSSSGSWTLFKNGFRDYKKIKALLISPEAHLILR